MPSRLTEEQLEALVQDYQRPLLVFATRLLQDPQDAEEVVNDVFLTSGMRADLSRGTAALRSWMYTITRNLCRDRLRKKRLDTVSLNDNLSATSPSYTEDTFSTEENPRVLKVREIIGGLPKRYQALFEMRYRYQLTRKEIGSILGVKEGTVDALLFKLKESIKRELGSDE